MFCMRCGQEVPAAAEFCPACGQSTKPPEQPAAQPTSYGTAPPPPQVQQAGFKPAWTAQPTLKGVGGFLLVFCLCLIIVWPLWAAGQFLLHPATLHYLTLNPIGMLGLLRTAFGVAVGVSLWMESRSALVMLRIYFVVAVVLMAMNILSIGTFLLRHSSRLNPAVFAGILISFVPYALFLALGIGYFAKSEQVRATYGGNLL